MFDQVLSGTGTLMVCGMLKPPAELFSSRSSGEGGVLLDVSISGGSLNVDTSDSRCAFLVGFSLYFCEGVFDFCDFFNIFQFSRIKFLVAQKEIFVTILQPSGEFLLMCVNDSDHMWVVVVFGVFCCVCKDILVFMF